MSTHSIVPGVGSGVESGKTNQGRLQWWHFWLIAVAISGIAYWICLRFLFPGYFHPFAAFHRDFYDYVGLRASPFSMIIPHFPRPVAFSAMKIMGSGGFDALMFEEIVIALLNVLLTVALAGRVMHLEGPPAIALFTSYIFLLFAHPAFYFEHRHDLPAEVSYFFLLLSLLCWIDGTRSSKATRYWLLGFAIPFAALFVFSKESYFVTALCVIFGLFWNEPKNRRWHAGYFVTLVVLEGVSLAWNKHVNGPFVDPNADANAPYHVSTAPAVVFKTFAYYLDHLLTPALVLIVIGSLWLARRNRRLLVGELVLICGALCAFLPHSVLPNHKFLEYSWLAAPLLIAPMLAPLPHLRHSIFYQRWLTLAGVAVLTSMAIIGPYGYKRAYQSDVLRWMADRDRIGGEVERSLHRYKQIEPAARILIAGLEEPGMPWHSTGFISSEFGDRRYWTVAVPPRYEFRYNSKLVQFSNAADIQLDRFDWIARYAPNGKLLDLRTVRMLDRSAPLAEILVPDMETPSKAAGNATLALQCADANAHWGFWANASACLQQAVRAGVASTDETVRRLSREIEAGSAPPLKTNEFFSLSAQRSPFVGSGQFGLGVVELTWQVPPGVYFEIHVNAPDGPTFVTGRRSGTSRTGVWVKRGMSFYLQDVRNGNPLTRQYTAAMLTIQ